MADLLSILFVPKPNRRVAIGAITLDATIEETHTLTNTITNHPMEEGSFVTDHAFEEPTKISIQGEITNTPVQILSILNGLSQRRIEAFEQLTALHKTRDILTIVTGLKIYSNMVMETLDVPRNQQTGGRLQFTATFQEVNKVASQIVGVAPQKIAPAQKDQVQSEQDIGRQETTEATPPQAAKAKSKSVLFSILGE